MNLQYISDDIGNPIGVFIPILDWKDLKSKFREIEQEEMDADEVPRWQTRIVRQRLKDYQTNPDKVVDWDQVQKEIEGEYGF